MKDSLSNGPGRWMTALALLVVAGLVVLGGRVSFGSSGASPAAAASGTAAGGTVSTTATGTENAVPDNLQASLDIHITGDTAAAVLTDDNTRTQTLLDDLKKAGVSDKDVQTTQLSLNTTYDDQGNVTGYQADDTLTVTFRDLKKAGAQLDAMVAVAGNAARIESVQFGFNDEDSITAAAREDAVKRARIQAADMATAAGASLGAVRTITEIVNSPTTLYAPESASAAGAVPSAAVPLAAGTQAITVQVRVVFALS